MPRSVLEQIRQLIRESRYEMTDHAQEEIEDDGLLPCDVETAILTGEIAREDKGDLRGTVYVIEGVGTDRYTPVGCACRFNERRIVLIITAYKIT